MHPFSSARLHRLIQLGFVLFLSWVAWRLHEYAQGVSGNGAFVPRPAAAEAFLPLSALLGLKRFLLTGQYDPIHPAGLTSCLSPCVRPSCAAGVSAATFAPSAGSPASSPVWGHGLA